MIYFVIDNSGYGAAFPRNSKHFANINRKIMEYSENGDLERLRRFWLTGTCNPKKEEKKASEPLAPEQVSPWHSSPISDECQTQSAKVLAPS